MEQIIELNTGSEGIATFKTKKITGKVTQLIVASEEKVSLKLDSELGYCLLDTKEISGIKTCQIGQDVTNNKHERYVQSWAPYDLKESVLIQTEGPKNTVVKIIIRTE